MPDNTLQNHVTPIKLRSPSTSGKYLQSWDTSASVRTQPGRTKIDLEQQEGCFFNHKLMNVLRHPIVRDLDAWTIRRLEAMYLNRFLKGVEFIETCLVNPANLEIVSYRHIPDEVRLNAYRIYTDEGYHAFMSAELRASLASTFSLTDDMQTMQEPLRNILGWIEGLNADVQPLALITAASMNETLITGSFLQAQDRSLIPPVRESIRVHAQDEAGHHVFYLNFFPEFWNSVPVQARQAVAERVPWILFTLLSADLDCVIKDLCAVGLDGPDSRQIVASTCTPVPSLVEIEKAAQGCVGMLERAGACAWSEISKEYKIAIERGGLDEYVVGKSL